MNVLVEFDQEGKVTKSEALSDKRIVAELQRVLAQHAKLNASPPEIVTEFSPQAAWYCSCGLKATSRVMEFFVRPKTSPACKVRCPSGVSLPTQNLTVMPTTTEWGSFNSSQIGWIRIKFHFSENTAIGKELPVDVKLADLVALLTFVESVRPANQNVGPSLAKPADNTDHPTTFFLSRASAEAALVTRMCDKSAW